MRNVCFYPDCEEPSNVGISVYGVWNDHQIPYHDPRAFNIAVEILKDVKLDKLIYNGDWADFRAISRYPIYNKNPKLFSELRAEIAVARERLHAAHKAIKPKKAAWNSGNHEFRMFRAFEKIPAAMQVLEITEIGEAITIPAIFQLDKLGIKFSGEYPQGCWLHGQIETSDDVWVEHGYTARAKPGYTVSGVMDKRWSSAIVGHCEKLAGPIWTRKLGKSFFGIENGNISCIAEPGLGDGIYGGIPHSVPAYMDHQQGFSIVYRDSGKWFPYCIRISQGKAFWNGRTYKA